MKYLQSCCCGCTLKKGTLIIGYLNLVSAVTFLLAGSALLSVANDPQSNADVNIIINGKNVTIPVLTSLVALIVPLVIIYLLLVIGAHKERKWLLTPWILTHFLALVGIFIIICIPSTYGEGVAAQVIGRLLGLALQVYFFMVIVSFFKEIERKDVATWETLSKGPPTPLG